MSRRLNPIPVVGLVAAVFARPTGVGEGGVGARLEMRLPSVTLPPSEILTFHLL
jgi:hypothetical protein